MMKHLILKKNICYPLTVPSTTSTNTKTSNKKTLLYEMYDEIWYFEDRYLDVTQLHARTCPGLKSNGEY